jgi:hypothetical protein
MGTNWGIIFPSVFEVDTKKELPGAERDSEYRPYTALISLTQLEPKSSPLFQEKCRVHWIPLIGN